MKKKIIALAVASVLMVGGVVSAASMWGTYKGQDIVRITVDGVPVQVKDAPAINFDNRTMVPIYLLDQAGIKFSWDNSTKTVDVKKNEVVVSGSYSDQDVLGIKYYFSLAAHFNNMMNLGEEMYETLAAISYAFRSVTDKYSADTNAKMAKDRLNNLKSRATQSISTNDQKIRETLSAGWDVSEFRSISTGYQEAISLLEQTEQTYSSFHNTMSETDAKKYLDLYEKTLDAIKIPYDLSAKNANFYFNHASK